jgi:hypothetical protein
MQLTNLSLREESSMKRLILVFSIVTTLITTNHSTVFAQTNAVDKKISLTILSPDKVKDYPGREETIKVRVTNNTDKDIHDVLVYITMADIKKNMTVNLEDYSADKPVFINTLKVNESKTIELPIRFVYTSDYYLYTTVTSKEYKEIVSSDAIPVEILGNTKIDKSKVISVVIFEPFVLIGGIMLISLRRRYKYKVV